MQSSRAHNLPCTTSKCLRIAKKLAHTHRARAASAPWLQSCRKKIAYAHCCMYAVRVGPQGTCTSPCFSDDAMRSLTIKCSAPSFLPFPLRIRIKSVCQLISDKATVSVGSHEGCKGNVSDRQSDGMHLDIQRAAAQHARQLRALPAGAAQVIAMGRCIPGLLHFLRAELQVRHLQTWLPASVTDTS